MPDICKCGAEISFLRMTNGRLMPYRLDSSEKRLVRFQKGTKVYGRIVDAFIPHWADCSFADEFRKTGVGFVDGKADEKD